MSNQLMYAVFVNVRRIILFYPHMKTVAGYLKRSLAGSRKGHSAAVIVSDVKDFAFVYKNGGGKVVIGFSFGKLNVSGFPQHT